jgi:hypothetical protein
MILTQGDLELLKQPTGKERFLRTQVGPAYNK